MDARLDELLDLLDAADAADGESVGTSMRIPAALRRAAALATEMGLTMSTTEMAVRGLRDQLRAVADQAVLDAHYERYPHARPNLAELALATAKIDGSPLAERPDLIERAASEIGAFNDDPSPDDVLMFAAGIASAA